jgi:hypothetical protein
MKYIVSIMLGLLGFVLIYLLTSFAEWEINASKWSYEVKHFTIYCGIFAFFCFSIQFLLQSNDKSN